MTNSRITPCMKRKPEWKLNLKLANERKIILHPKLRLCVYFKDIIK